LNCNLIGTVENFVYIEKGHAICIASITFSANTCVCACTCVEERRGEESATKAQLVPDGDKCVIGNRGQGLARGEASNLIVKSNVLLVLVALRCAHVLGVLIAHVDLVAVRVDTNGDPKLWSQMRLNLINWGRKLPHISISHTQWLLHLSPLHCLPPWVTRSHTHDRKMSNTSSECG
jgi:hypothetical protein